MRGGWYENKGGSAVQVLITASAQTYQACIARFYQAAGKFAQTASAVNSSWASATLDLQKKPVLDYSGEYRLDWLVFSPTSPANGCGANCVGGFCQPQAGQNSTAPARCYSSGTPCATGYVCTLPGPRHGHSLLHLLIAGKSVALLFGGETTDLRAPAPALSAELFSAFVQGDSMQWASLALGYLSTDGEEHSCGFLSAACPAKRRDAALILVGNTGGDNGRMLLFGGMTYCQVKKKYFHSK
jgi:hypothetical protein